MTMSPARRLALAVLSLAALAAPAEAQWVRQNEQYYLPAEHNWVFRRNYPPRVPLEEAAIEIGYVKLAPEAKLMFEWAHVLHRQLYDVLADERLSPAEKDAAVAEVLAYYRSRPDLAFSGD